jgi:hypothetical protein
LLDLDECIINKTVGYTFIKSMKNFIFYVCAERYK